MLQYQGKQHPKLRFVLEVPYTSVLFMMQGAMAEAVLSLGYQITFAPEGANDVNKSVQRFGIIWTVHELMKNIPKNADDARVKINLNCI
jgi:hypothetical protein